MPAKTIHSHTIPITVLYLSLLFSLSGCVISRKDSVQHDPRLKKEYTIGISQRWGTTVFPRTIVQGARDSAMDWEKKTGVKIRIIVTDCGNDDPSRQIKDMENLASRKVDGLLLFPGDSEVVSEPLIRIFNKNDIPVVITDIGVERGDYLSIIITNNRKGGEMAAEEMARQIPAGGKVVVFNNGPGNNNARDRADGFMEKAKELGFQVLPERIVKIDAEEGRKLMEEVLVSEPDIAGVFTLTIEPAIGAVGALKTARNKTCKIVAFDINAVGLKLIKDGSLAACVLQDPYFIGVEGMNQLMYHFTDNTGRINKLIDSPTTVCTRANTARYETNPQVKL